MPQVAAAVGARSVLRRTLHGVDAREIIAQLRADPGLRDLLRAVLLTDELLQLPAIVRLQGENLARLTDRVDELARLQAEQSRSLGQALVDLGSVVARLVDRVDDQLRVLEGHSRTLEAHSRMLEAHSRTLEDHSRTLEDHGQMLQAATDALGRIEERLA